MGVNLDGNLQLNLILHKNIHTYSIVWAYLKFNGVIVQMIEAKQGLNPMQVIEAKKDIEALHKIVAIRL